MDHHDIRHRLSDYIDDTLTRDERAAVDAHLSTCTDCSDALHELRTTIEHLRSVEEIEPPEWMTKKVMARVREEGQRRSSKRMLLDHFAIWRPVRILAVLALTVAAYYVYLNLGPFGKPVDTPPEAASRKEAPVSSPLPPQTPASGEGPIARQTAPDRSGRIAPRRGPDVAQSPEYRSLDMKYSYEQPPPPEPAAPSASDAPDTMIANKAIPPKSTESARPLSAAPTAAVPRAERRTEEPARDEAPSPAAAAGTAVAVIHLSLVADAVPDAAAKIAEAVVDSGGTVVRIDVLPPVTVLRATLPTQALPKLKKALQQIGSLHEKTPSAMPDQDRAAVEITIRRIEAGP